MATNNFTDDTVPITEYMVFETIMKKTECKTKTPNYTTCEDRFRAQYLLKNNEEFSKFFKKSWTRYNRLKSTDKKKGNLFILSKASKESVSMDREPPVEQPSETKKRRKSFIELGPRMQKERTEGLLNHINEFIAKEGPELSVTQVLGYLVHRVNIQSEKKIARIGYELYSGTANVSHSFEVDEAIALMHDLTLSREQMIKLRRIMASKGIIFPTSNELLEGRKKLRPVITPVLEDKGVQVQYKDLVKMTVESVLALVDKKKLDGPGILEMVFKDGGDGAGQQV